jgi:M6 family metalloprotease-like protein
MSDRSLKRFCLGSVLALFCAVVVEAAYLRNVPVHVQQPDGTVLSCLASGDEHYNWLHDQNGYTIMRDPATGFLVYANKVAGRLVPTEFIAGRTDAGTLARAGIKARLLDEPKTREMRVAAAANVPIVNAPSTGTINNLVVYVRFSDQTDFAQALVDSTAVSFNSITSGADSMRNYYAEASYGQLTVSSTFYPGSTPGIYSYQDAHPRAYYMPYDAMTNPGGYPDENERRIREHALLRTAVNAIAAEVPAGLNIDGDSDGSIDNICFIVRGEPTAWSTLLWPHQWSLYTAPYAYINGKLVWTYNFQMETRLDVGVLCHEMFHSLGAPDLYHYSSDGLEPVWAWDLMEWNLDPPEHMGAYMKWKYGHWIASIPEITTSGTYTLHPLTSATNNCYKIASPSSSTEFFIVEFRRKTNGGTFEGNLFNEGLLVYRINTAYTGNASGPPDEVYIYRPGGTTTLDGVPWLAPLSADQSRTAINDATDPSSFLTAGSPGGLSISNVGLLGNTISFDVAINTITVTAPNGGETWMAGDSRTVTWLSTGSMSTVDIQLSTNSGSTWTTLADNTPNDGSQAVTVPLVASATCLMRVAEGTYGLPSDTSNATFSIVIPPSPITVTSPNGGEVWEAGSSHNVTWTQSGMTGSVTIDLYKGGILQKTLGTAGATSGTFSWAIAAAETVGYDYRIRVWQGTSWDESDADFAVVVAATLPFSEDFTASPAGWVQQNGGTGIGTQWGLSATNYAGGSSYELRCAWADVNPGITRVITPPINTTGYASLRLRFKHFLDAFGTGCVLKVQTSPDRTNWTDEAWTIASTSSNVGPETVVTTLTHNLNIPMTFVAFTISGNLYQYDFWYIDDVSIFRPSPKVDFNSDGQEDILWRHYGSGGYNRAWFLGDSGQSGLPLLPPDAPMKTDVAGSRPGERKSSGRFIGGSSDLRFMPVGRALLTSKSSRDLMGKSARGTSDEAGVSDPRLAGRANPEPSPMGYNDPRDVKIGVPANPASGPELRLASIPTYLGGADVLPVGDLNWQIVGTGDFDNNTHVDILWRNSSTGANVVWLMNGAEWSGSAELLPVGDLSWQIVGTGDFNKDTHVDILWRNSASGDNVIWYMNGTSWIGSAVLLKVSDQNWKIVGTGDFNKDGNVDILWRNGGPGGSNVVWYMNNATWTGSAELIPVGDATWQIAGTGDYNNDGNVDILWHYNGAGGYNYIWYMDHVTWIGGGDLLPVADLTWRIVSR